MEWGEAPGVDGKRVGCRDPCGKKGVVVMLSWEKVLSLLLENYRSARSRARKANILSRLYAWCLMEVVEGSKPPAPRPAIYIQQ